MMWPPKVSLQLGPRLLKSYSRSAHSLLGLAGRWALGAEVSRRERALPPRPSWPVRPLGTPAASYQ